MTETLTSINWMQVVATIIPMLFSGTAMFLWLAWTLGRRMERLLVVVGTVGELGTRVLVIETDMGAVKADIVAIKLSASERREDFVEFRRMLDSIMLRNAQS